MSGLKYIDTCHGYGGGLVTSMLVCLPKSWGYPSGWAARAIQGSVVLVAGSLEAAYSLNWGAQKIWGKDGGETLALL